MGDRTEDYMRVVKKLEASRAREKRLRDVAELAYSEMAFTVHDISDPRRRRQDGEWSEQRGASLAKAADELRAAIDATGGEGDA